VAEVETAWVGLKIATTSPGLTYSEIAGLDVFEFFTLLREVQRRNKPR
jgi:hypothetical protein